jgi:hypothetical protein
MPDLPDPKKEPVRFWLLMLFWIICGLIMAVFVYGGAGLFIYLIFTLGPVEVFTGFIEFLLS